MLVLWMARLTTRSFGALLRDWRLHRRLSQLELALQAEISPRHLSFVETSRANPSREMVLHLAEQLDLPLRERNGLLLAAGYAPVFSEKPLDEAAMADIRAALRLVLRGHEPYPAIVVDRHWNLIDANASAALLTAGAAPALLAPPCNVLRLSFHPDGVAARIINLGEWRSHVLERLRREAAAFHDRELTALYEELRTYSCAEPAVALSPAAAGRHAAAHSARRARPRYRILNRMTVAVRLFARCFVAHRSQRCGVAPSSRLAANENPARFVSFYLRSGI